MEQINLLSYKWVKTFLFDPLDDVQPKSNLLSYKWVKTLLFDPLDDVQPRTTASPAYSVALSVTRTSISPRNVDMMSINKI